ncbi:MAG: phospholipid carrier-dependent glycosyltransferase, partial [Deltaproteobacteria bacterium]|nr:phospholipid carrier-dependent glycosyltransferase [Deltaproteobacteria bacterium]
MGDGLDSETKDTSFGAKTSRPMFAALCLLILANTLVSSHVILADRVPPTHDVLFMSRAAAMLARAVLGEPGMWSGFLDATRDLFYPPLTHFTALPFSVLYPDTFDAAAMSISLYSAILMMAVFAIGQRLRDEATGLLAATLATLSPAALGFSRVYLVDWPLAALVAATLAMALATDRFSSRKFSIALGVLCGCGLLIKQT